MGTSHNLICCHFLQFDDAIVLVTLADKFDMPSIIKICEPVLCEETVNMHFAGDVVHPALPQ